jgi:hypothetical protein
VETSSSCPSYLLRPYQRGDNQHIQKKNNLTKRRFSFQSGDREKETHHQTPDENVLGGMQATDCLTAKGMYHDCGQVYPPKDPSPHDFDWTYHSHLQWDGDGACACDRPFQAELHPYGWLDDGSFLHRTHPAQSERHEYPEYVAPLGVPRKG